MTVGSLRRPRTVNGARPGAYVYPTPLTQQQQQAFVVGGPWPTTSQLTGAAGATAAAAGTPLPLPAKPMTTALRVLIVFVIWNVMLSARFFLLVDQTFPIEALLPVVYGAFCLFFKHDELLLWNPSTVVDAVIVGVIASLVCDVAVAEVLVRVFMLVNGFEWCRLRFAVAVIPAIVYLFQAGFSGTATTPPLSTEPRHPIVFLAVYAALGLSFAMFLRANKVMRRPRAALQVRVDRGLDALHRKLCSSPVMAAALMTVDKYAVRPIINVVFSRRTFEVSAWLIIMTIDWYEQISLGGLAMAACLLVGFGATVAQDRAAGQPRYVYQILLVVAVWASDVTVFLVAPPRGLPFIANSVISAYFVLYCAAPAPSPPKVTSRLSSTLHIVPVPPRETSVVLPLLAWIGMVSLDFCMQIRRGWTEPNLGRAMLAVNTVGYGVLILTSTFLDAYSRDARVRARMTFLQDDHVSPDTVALRQIVDDMDGTRELESAFASAGLDLRSIVDRGCGHHHVFTSSLDDVFGSPNAGG